MLAGNVKAFDFLSKTRGLLNIGEPEPAKVTEGPDETIDRKTEENRQLNTMVLNSLLLNHKTDSEIKTCCPRSLVKWQRKHSNNNNDNYCNCNNHSPRTWVRV